LPGKHTHRLLDGIRPAKAKVGAILRERAAAAKK
jgi:hypothetical protein